MHRTDHMQERLATKTDMHTLMETLTTRYALSLAEAECLSQELAQRQRQDATTPLADGQVWYTAVCADEPAGKPLNRCRTRRIRLTLHDTVELTTRHETSLAALERLLVSRLCFEAYAQGTLLAQEDLCRLLYLSRATVQRILASYRQAGDFIPTRGAYHDIGPTTTHKAQAIRLYLRGCQPSEIAQRLCHQLSSIERYLDDFCRVVGAQAAGLSPATIARITGHSPHLVAEYQTLYRTFAADPAYQEALARLEERSQLLLAGKKGGLP
jgi:hypothetical protein